jgi:ferritin-like metal-binding protein YciE
LAELTLPLLKIVPGDLQPDAFSDRDRLPAQSIALLVEYADRSHVLARVLAAAAADRPAMEPLQKVSRSATEWESTFVETVAENQANSLQPRRRSSSNEKTLNDLFLALLKTIYYAEKMISRTLPRMVKAAREPELKKAFTTHREETQGQIERLEQVFEMIGKRPQAKPCEAINGIVAEGEETIEDFGESPAIDTGLVAAGRAVEHYEMARYGALVAWAGQLGMPEAAALLNQTLQEEMKAERLLAQIGASEVDKVTATKTAAA